MTNEEKIALSMEDHSKADDNFWWWLAVGSILIVVIISLVKGCH